MQAAITYSAVWGSTIMLLLAFIVKVIAEGKHKPVNSGQQMKHFLVNPGVPQISLMPLNKAYVEVTLHLKAL